MKKRLLVVFALCIILQPGLSSYAADQGKDIDSILSSAESLFKAMRARDYARTWEFLSDRSKDRIVDSTLRAVRKAGENFSEEQIREDFSSGGSIAQSYWNGYLEHFDPNKALEESRWQMGLTKKTEAEILITYKKTDNPAKIRMFNEKGSWKVGLIETFGTKK